MATAEVAARFQFNPDVVMAMPKSELQYWQEMHHELIAAEREASRVV